MIIIDKKYPDCTAIDTQEFIRKTIGQNNENGIELPDIIHNADWSDESALIVQFVTEREGVPYKSVYRDNVYNHENDFSDVFVFEIFVPVDSPDWCYDDNAYISICIHRGGDVRGNYGATALYKISDCIAESGFLDWTIGWNISDLQGNRIDDDITQRFSIGYSSAPWYELIQYIHEKTIHYSEKRQAFVARYNGKTVILEPYTNVY